MEGTATVLLQSLRTICLPQCFQVHFDTVAEEELGEGGGDVGRVRREVGGEAEGRVAHHWRVSLGIVVQEFHHAGFRMWLLWLWGLCLSTLLLIKAAGVGLLLLASQAALMVRRGISRLVFWRQNLPVLSKLALNSWSSCLRLMSAETASLHHHLWLTERVPSFMQCLGILRTIPCTPCVE